MRDKRIDYKRLPVLVGTIIFFLTSCSFPTQPQTAFVQEDDINTAVSGTLNAWFTNIPSATSTPTFSVSTITEIPTATMVPSASATLLKLTPTNSPQPTASYTPTATSLPIINAEVDTNCRQGPSAIYKVVGYLLVGVSSLVHGRDSKDYWWYIENPSKPGLFCWVWSESTIVKGDVADLPVITPPPTPTSPSASGKGFSILSTSIITCGDSKIAFFKVRNNGNVALESGTLKIDNLSTGERVFGVATSNSPFAKSKDCYPSFQSRLNPGATKFIAGPLGSSTKKKHNLSASIQLCTLEGLKGSCYGRSINFKSK